MTYLLISAGSVCLGKKLNENNLEKRMQKHTLLGTNLGVNNPELALIPDRQRAALADLNSKQSAFKDRCIAGVQGFRSE